jgi:hypothetical protein
MDSEIIFNCLSHVSLTTYFAALCRKYKKKKMKNTKQRNIRCIYTDDDEELKYESTIMEKKKCCEERNEEE